MSRVFYTSDHHIGHKLVAVERSFRIHGNPGPLADWEKDLIVAWHDEELAKRWDSVVTPADTVFVCGDISVGGTTAQRSALEWMAQRPGTKHLVTGNHDGVHPANRDADKWVEAYHRVFASVFPFRRRKIAGRNVMLSHYPYEGDHTSVDRDVQYRLRDDGLPVLHGHIHSTSKGDARQIHIGVDAWDLTPVPQSAIEEILEGAQECP